MGRSIFGWSYPPGCNGPPDDFEVPCILCGYFEDKCTCKECPECKEYGCLEHIKSWELASIIRDLEFRVEELQYQAKKREKKTLPCPHCWQSYTISIFDEGPICCGEYEYSEKLGWGIY
jgi:hypothetical protein